jgi:hypothetical protein
MFERRDYLIFSTVYLAFTFSTLLWIGGLRDLGLLAGMFVGCLLALMFAVTGSEMRRLAREAELRRAVPVAVGHSSLAPPAVSGLQQDGVQMKAGRGRPQLRLV